MMRSQMFVAAFLIYFNRHYFSTYSLKEYLKRIPFVRDKLLGISLSLQNSLDTKYENIKRLPQNPTDIDEAMNKLDIVKSDQQIDRISGIIYHQDKDHYSDLLKVFENMHLQIHCTQIFFLRFAKWKLTLFKW